MFALLSPGVDESYGQMDGHYCVLPSELRSLSLCEKGFLPAEPFGICWFAKTFGRGEREERIPADEGRQGYVREPGLPSPSLAVVLNGNRVTATAWNVSPSW